MTSPGSGGESWQPPNPQGPGWQPPTPQAPGWGTPPPQGPGWGAPAPAPGWGGPVGPMPPKTNSLAIVALVAGIAQCMLSVIGSVVAIVCGHIARRQIRNAQGRETGAGLALAGIILGYIGLVLNVLAVVGVVVFLLAFSDDVDRADLRDDAKLVRATIQFDASGEENPRDPSLILRSLEVTEAARDSDDVVYLANGVDPETATITDWDNAQWQLEFSRRSVTKDVYVCMTIPEAATGVFVIENGRCPAGGVPD